MGGLIGVLASRRIPREEPNLAEAAGKLALDIDGDGVLTLADASAILARLPDWAAQAFFYPGDSFISFLLKHDAILGLARHFEIKPEWHGGVFSGFISVVAWIVALLILVRLGRLVGHGILWLKTMKKRRRLRARLP